MPPCFLSRLRFSKSLWILHHVVKGLYFFSNVAVQTVPLESGKGFLMTLEISDVMVKMCEQDAWDSDETRSTEGKQKETGH